MTLETIAHPGTISFTVNGRPAEVAANGGRRLLDVLREDLGLTGTKEGCGEGECGACSILLDGRLVNSCLVPICQVEGHEVRTVEGMAGGATPDPLGAAFAATGAAQCGFCTPGMLAAGRAFIDSGAAPTEAAMREAIAGNLCRCTGYTKIVEAIALAASNPAGEVAPGWQTTAARQGSDSGGSRAASESTAAEAAADTSPHGSHDPASVSPATLDEAFRLMAERRWRPVAGGTDLMVTLAAGAAGTGLPLLDLWKLDELRGIRLETGSGAAEGPGVLVLGGLTTYAEMRGSRLVAEHLPVLAEMAAAVGAAQIQNRGTLGGNIANASPAGDTLPVLLATDAVIVVRGIGGERRVPAAAFFTGYRTTARSPEELIVRVEIPLPPGRRVRFRKVGTRHALAISKVVMAVSWHELEPATAGGAAPRRPAWHDVRVAVGSVAPVPMRARATEAVLDGAAPTRTAADRAAAAIAAEIVPIDDVRSTASYRRAVTARILRRIVREAGGW